MYNPTVETAHTFYVGEQGWLVHNATCDPWDKTNGLLPKVFPSAQKGISGVSPFKQVSFAVKNPLGEDIYLTQHSLVTMRQRKCGIDSVLETINNPVSTREASDFRFEIGGGNESGSATIYFAADGSAVVLNNATRQVIQVTKPGFKF